MNITEQGVAITNRFFQAINTLIEERRMRGLNTFTEAHGLNRWNIITVREDPSGRYLQPEWIAWLCHDYNISPEWVLFGTGTFYKHNRPPKASARWKNKMQEE